MMMSLLVNFCFSSESNIAQPSIEVELLNLRDKLKTEAKSKHLNYYDPEFILSDTLCIFTGRTHEDYTYSVIQTLFADDLFFKKMIMEDFQKDQEVCKLLQMIALKMYEKDEINIEDEIKELIDIKEYSLICNIRLNEYDFMHSFLVSHLIVLNMPIEETIVSKLFGLKRKTIAYCGYNGWFSICKRNIKYSDEITNNKRNIQEEIAGWIKRTEKSVELCYKCAQELENDAIEFCIASRFILRIKQTKDTQKRIFGVNPDFHQLKIRGVIYILYAVMCEYRYSGDKELSHYNLTLKGKDWYKFINEEVFKIDIESGKILDYVMGNSKNKNALKSIENENKDIIFENLIYYYRRIK